MAREDHRLRTAVMALLLVFSVGASPAMPVGLLLSAEPPEILDQLREAKVVLAEPRSETSGGIVGREVHTVLDPEFEDNQLGTVHYHYLTNTAGGLLIVGRGWDEHLQQLDATLARPRQDVMKPFIKAFVRPHGLEVAATPRFVEQVEAMAGLQIQPARRDALAFVWRRAIDRLRAARHDERYDRWILSERELGVKLRNKEHREKKMREHHAARKARQAAEKARKAVH